MASSETQGLQLGSAARPVVKLSIFFNKKADLSYEEFNTYWSETHGPLFNSLPIAKEKVIKYNQYHVHTSSTSKFASLGIPLLEFDAAVELWAKDVESLLAVFNDAEYLKTIVPDEEKIIDRESGKFMLGYDDLQFDQS